MAETLHVIPTEDSDWSVWVSGERAVVNIIGGRDRKQLAVGDWSIRAKKGRYAGREGAVSTNVVAVSAAWRN